MSTGVIEVTNVKVLVSCPTSIFYRGDNVILVVGINAM
jgi:hypothetical protein